MDAAGEQLTPADRERLQLEAFERWFAMRPIDRGHVLYFARLRAVEDVRRRAELETEG